MDKTTIPGILFGIGMILLGQKLEGGHAGSLLQLTAFMIVVGGTIGAVLVSYPLGEVIGGIKGLKLVMQEKPSDIVQLITQLVELATIARRDGVLALEGKLAEVKDARDRIFPALDEAAQLLEEDLRSELSKESADSAKVRVRHDALERAFDRLARVVEPLLVELELVHVRVPGPRAQEGRQGERGDHHHQGQAGGQPARRGQGQARLRRLLHHLRQGWQRRRAVPDPLRGRTRARGLWRDRTHPAPATRPKKRGPR